MEGGRAKERRGGEGEGGGAHTVHVIKAEKMNKEKHTYPKAADLHRLFLGTLLNLLLLKLPRGSALDSQEKSKTEMISTRLGNSNKIHTCMPEKKGGRIDRGLEREGLEGGAGRGGVGGQRGD